jgi:heme/copper-type cytochrome/quinol oxidase subunit 3
MTALEGVEAEATRPRAVARELPAGRSTAWWGMVLLITTEGAIFAAFIASYFYLRFRSTAGWPPEGLKVPELSKPLIMSVLLFSSSGTMVIADRAIRRGRVGALKGWLAATFLLGAGFLGLQANEYISKLAELDLTTNVYGSLFYGITGFHGSHVAVGLLMLAWVQAAAWRGWFTAERHERVRLVGMYWHFVDTVWAAILLSLYLSPRL